MKVLFAVSNENISDSIIKKYQQEYREIISSKNVYYFNAIIKELQKDKSYDRIVISEDLEPFANNNYEVIDKFIFEKLDNISDEATKNDGNDIPIILICADRRSKSENLLVKLFGIGVYSGLLGQDRSVPNVCELINKPRSKKDAKIYYRIDSDDVEYGQEGTSDVSEVEIQNILNHYKRLGKNEEKYVESFDSIATQYTDAQLRVICKFLPLNVRAVLESNSPKYQEIVTFGSTASSVYGKGATQQIKTTSNYNDYGQNARKKPVKNVKVDTPLDVIERNMGKSNLTKPVVIPSSMDISQVKKAEAVSLIKEKIQEEILKEQELNPSVEQQVEIQKQEEPVMIEENNIPNIKTELIEEPVKRKRGRPRKVQPVVETTNMLSNAQNNIQASQGAEQPPVKRKRGRPRKIQPEETTVLPGFEELESVNEQLEEVNLFDLGKETEVSNEVNLFDLVEEETPQAAAEINLFDLEEETEEVTTVENAGGIILPGFDDEVEEKIDNVQEQQTTYTPPSYANYRKQEYVEQANRNLERTQNYGQMNADLSSLLSRDRKVVAFVGTSKNGVSFLVNNLADILSKKGINTAILDLTKNKNSYYIYTQNEEELRKKAYNSMRNLRNGSIDGGIQISKNLTVFTTLPEENPDIQDYQNILTTLARNYSLILLDCDFDTEYGYFDCAQELYLVQSFDILTIQPLTAFLRDLKSKNILKPERLRIVLNKVLRVRSISERTIIGGMAYYNDPAMSFMTELFDKENVKYCVIPFEEQTYSRYLEGLVNCQITTNGYSKDFMMNLEKLGNMVYPLISNNYSRGNLNTYNTNTGFSNNMNETLNKMKNRY